PAAWMEATDKSKYFPIFQDSGYVQAQSRSTEMNFVMVDAGEDHGDAGNPYLDTLVADPTVVLCLSSTERFALHSVRNLCIKLGELKSVNPIILITDSSW